MVWSIIFSNIIKESSDQNSESSLPIGLSPAASNHAIIVMDEFLFPSTSYCPWCHVWGCPECSDVRTEWRNWRAETPSQSRLLTPDLVDSHCCTLWPERAGGRKKNAHFSEYFRAKIMETYTIQWYRLQTLKWTSGSIQWDSPYFTSRTCASQHPLPA